MSIWHKIIRAGERAMNGQQRAVKRAAKNAHYRECTVERGISPKSFARAQAKP